jgi:hypothetical protein
MRQRSPSLFADAVKIISKCIDHINDDDLPGDEQKSRDLLIEYYKLLVSRRRNPNYGKPKGGDKYGSVGRGAR